MRRFDTAVSAAAVRTGVSLLCANPALLEGQRIGVVTNFTGVMPDLRRNIDALLQSGLQVVAIFGPEHGLRGTCQAGAAETDGVDEATGLPIWNTFLKAGQELDELIQAAGVDALVFDMQDIGVRYWTYVSTMYDAMCSAARTGKRFVVLDRPNPLGGLTAAGPGLEPGFESFVGRVDVPIRHGLTIGELATLFNTTSLPQQGIAADLDVVTMHGWCRSQDFARTGLPWVPPSPNMPTPQAALAFCGTALFEGTNVSEGRGTTTPFEIVGAPYIDARLVETLWAMEIPGVIFRDAFYVPTFNKYAGQLLRGVQLHVIDSEVFEPIACGLAMIQALASLYSDEFSFVTAADGDQPAHVIDRLWGSDELRLAVEAGQDVRNLRVPHATPLDKYPEHVLRYL